MSKTVSLGGNEPFEEEDTSQQIDSSASTTATIHVSGLNATPMKPPAKKKA
jgi:hypothetical protein